MGITSPTQPTGGFAKKVYCALRISQVRSVVKSISGSSFNSDAPAMQHWSIISSAAQKTIMHFFMDMAHPPEFPFFGQASRPELLRAGWQ
jgi:hypothetical protein